MVSLAPAVAPHRRRAERRHAATTRTFEVGGQKIAAIVERGAHPVLFLHGNSSTKRVWSNQIADVTARGRAVLAPDFPGHGESDDARDPEQTYSLPGYAAVIRALLDALGWSGVDVVGWSLGGHVGLELLATDARVRSLLIVGAPPAPPSLDSLQAVFHPSDDMNLAGKPEFSEAEAAAYGTAMMGGREFLTPALLAAVRRTDGRARQHLFASIAAGRGSDERACVETCATPLCVVHGAEEPFVRLDYLQSLRYRALWRQQIQVMSGAGHAPHRQKPALFNALLFAFLEDIAQGRASP